MAAKNGWVVVISNGGGWRRHLCLGVVGVVGRGSNGGSVVVVVCATMVVNI